MPDRPSAETAFAEALKKFRTVLSMSQAQLADKMAARGFRWHPATVYKIENGERQVQLAEALEIARIFDTTVESMSDDDRAISALRDTRNSLRSERFWLMRQIDSLEGSMEIVKEQLARPEVRERLSRDEYDEMHREANPDQEVIDAIMGAYHALHKWENSVKDAGNDSGT